MIEKLEKLEPEKQDGIRLAALQTFADKGFKDASTNRIVEQAGISKGTLFYYFKNKKGLYYYLIDYSLTVIMEEYISKIDFSATDLIERMSNNSKIKYRYYQQHPEVNHFLSTVLFKELTTLTPAYQEKFQRLIAETSEKMTQNQEMNTELFKEEVDPKEASKIIELSIEGYFSQLADYFKTTPSPDDHFEQLWEEFDAFLTTLRKVFYN